MKCDWCCQDYTNSEVSGGFMFDSSAVCPECAVKKMDSIIGYNEQSHIGERCPAGLSFADWVRRMRYASGNDKIIITTRE